MQLEKSKKTSNSESQMNFGDFDKEFEQWLNQLDPKNMTLEEIKKENEFMDNVENNLFDIKEKYPINEENESEEKPDYVWTEKDESEFRSDPDIPYWQKY